MGKPKLSEPRTKKRIIHPDPWRVLGIYAPLIGLWLVAICLSPSEWFNLYGALLIGLFMAFLGFMVRTVPRKQALVLNADHLAIEGAFATQDIAWKDIDSVRLKPGLRFGGLMFGQQIEITFRQNGHLNSRSILDWFELKGEALVTCLQESLER